MHLALLYKIDYYTVGLPSSWWRGRFAVSTPCFASRHDCKTDLNVGVRVYRYNLGAFSEKHSYKHRFMARGLAPLYTWLLYTRDIVRDTRSICIRELNAISKTDQNKRGKQNFKSLIFGL